MSMQYSPFTVPMEKRQLRSRTPKNACRSKVFRVLKQRFSFLPTGDRSLYSLVGDLSAGSGGCR